MNKQDLTIFIKENLSSEDLKKALDEDLKKALDTHTYTGTEFSENVEEFSNNLIDNNIDVFKRLRDR